MEEMGSTVKKKAERNKTIDFTLEEGQEYVERCLDCREQNTLEKNTPILKRLQDQIIIGDTLSLLPTFPKHTIDLVIADPPYNLAKNYHGNKFDRKSEIQYEEYTRDWLEQILPLMKPNASIYVCCDWRSSLTIGRVLQEYVVLRNRITWQREKGRGAKANWKNGMEDIWFGTLSDQYQFHVDRVMQRRRVLAPYRQEGSPKDWEETENGRYRDTCPSNFWDDISIPYWSMPENTAHPTQKPEKLLAKLILASSDPGDLILDPFGGSGSTAVTAAKLGRHYISIEQNPLYCAWTQKRLEMAQEQPRIQGYEDGVFWERNSKPSRKADKK